MHVKFLKNANLLSEPVGNTLPQHGALEVLQNINQSSGPAPVQVPAPAFRAENLLTPGPATCGCIHTTSGLGYVYIGTYYMHTDI